MPADWLDDLVSLNQDTPYVWAAFRLYDDDLGRWDQFHPPGLWAIYTLPPDTRTPSAPTIEARARGLSTDALFLFRVFMTPPDQVGRNSIESIRVAVATTRVGWASHTGFQPSGVIVETIEGPRVGSVLASVATSGQYFFSGQAVNPLATPTHGPWSNPVTELTSVEVGDTGFASAPTMALRRPSITDQGIILTITRPENNFLTGYLYNIRLFTNNPANTLDYITEIAGALSSSAETGQGLIQEGTTDFVVSGCGLDF